jgi:transposase
MFIRELKNRSGSISIQIISKADGKYKVVKTVGSSHDPQQIALLKQSAKQYIIDLQRQPSLFISKEDTLIESFLSSLSNGQVRVIGPELIFGRIYNAIGFSIIKEELFRHLVITRLSHPGSKLKTVDYLYRFAGIETSIDQIYRFLDKLQGKLKIQVEDIAYSHTKKVLKGDLSIVFYDMTTLHFESEDEDDLRKTGFSKVGKHQNPQIYLGLLVGLGGYAIGYDIFEGNIYEGHTLIPVLEKFETRFNLNKPIIVADAGLLNSKNIIELQKEGYQYILGSRIKNESKSLKEQILKLKLKESDCASIKKSETETLIISFSEKRAAKDAHNRQRGLTRLEKNLKAGRLTKNHINNKGYNKYLKLEGEVRVKIDYQKFKDDQQWDGLKGYLTNTKLSSSQVIENYNNLWQIEKAFRISKTDLRIRPIYHRLRARIEAHICIAFAAYTIYKELERVLYIEKAPFSATRAAALAQNMYQLSITLPHSKKTKQILMKMDKQQSHLKNIIDKNF